MDNLVKVTLRSQTIFSGFLFLFSVTSWSTVINQLKDYEGRDRLQFNCMPEEIKFKTQRCYNNYTSAMSSHLTPLGFAGITFGVSGFGWLFVTLLGVEMWRRIRKEANIERQKKLERLFFWVFIFHICGQFVLLVVMIGLFLRYQKLKYPAEYSCFSANTTLTCNDLRYKEKSNLNIAIIVVFSVSIVFCLLTIIHLALSKDELSKLLLGNIEEDHNGEENIPLQDVVSKQESADRDHSKTADVVSKQESADRDHSKTADVVSKQESADRDHSKTAESEISESSQEGSDDITAQVTTGLPSKDDTSSPQGDPPELNKVLPSSADIKAITKPSKHADLPVDILLLTVTNCEFLACYSELKNPHRCWFDGLGYVYFSDVGQSQEELKVALLRCYKNGIGPGGSLVSVKNAASVLRPKAVISVGTCSGLDPAKSKLGDVVVSAKLATYASKVVTSNQEQSTGMRSYVSKRFLNVIKNCTDGWQAPLKNPEAQQVQVCTDAEFLSGPEEVRAEWRRDQLAETNPRAKAIENEGEGVFTAAFDCQIEWLIVKGIADYADGSQLPSESWLSCASVMAASLVAHILSEPCVFHSWPHYQDISEQTSASRSKEQLPSPSGAATAFLEWSQHQLCSFYNSTASQLMITPWDQDNTMDIDEVYVQLTLLRDDRKLSGTTQKELEDYSELFASHGHHLIPNRILVYGRPGIGKSTLTKKLAVDWSRGNKEILKKFAVVLLIKLRDVCNTQDFCAMLQKAELLSAGDPMVFSQLYDYILRNQQKVLLILDGYDECSAEKSSPFHLIWKGTQLRDCTLLVTTRSLKKDELRPGSHAQFEINGFDQCQVKTFALKFLRDEAKVDKFLRFLREHSLGALAEIPLLLLMLVLSWNVNDYQGPSASRALLYSSFCQTLLDHVTTKTSDRTFRSIDEYKEDLAKLGELAWQALLNDCLYFKLSNVPEDIRLFLEKFIDFGFLQTSNLSNSPRPEKLAFFLHKSVQEFLSALFIVRDLKNAKETFNCLSKLDFLKQFDEVLEVFKFVSELSSEATVAIFRHLKMTGEKEGLTDYNFGENPSIEELTREQREFYRISLDLFLSCPTSERENVYPSFLQCVNGLVVIEDKQLPKVSSEHCLRSTNFHDKPDYVFFTSDSPRESKVLVDQMFSVMSDLDTVVVTFYGDVKSINTCRYNDLKRKEFVIKKVGHRLVFCLTRLEFISRTSPKFIELLTSLISAPKPSLQEPDHVSHNHDVCNSLQLTKKTSEQTLTHSLSYVRKSKIWGPTSELVSLLNTLHHVPRLSKLDVLHVGMENQECPLLATALTYVDKLRLLRLSDNPLGRGISVLAKHLYSVPHLKKLDLIATQMGEEEVTALAHSLKYVTQLSELDLSNNPLGHGIIELAKHLYSVPHLIKLYLRATQMVEEEVTALAHSLKYVTQLSELDLSNNPLGHGIIELAKHLYSVPDLIKLYLRATQMGEEEVTALARSLRYVTQLSELDLSNNPLGHGIIELAKHLYSVRHLKKLDLRATQMGEEEVTALACSLKYVTQLSELDLLNNPLGHRISELAKQLHNVPHLEKLCLQNTQMDEEEVKALAHSLKNVTQLSELHLSNNPLGHGISEFAKHLHNVPHLKKLYLDDTQMGVGEVTALAHILINVPELELLSLGKNPLGRGVTELIKCLRSSPQLSDLGLKNVQLTKKEAIELCTLANERNFLMAPWRSFPHFTSFVTNKWNMNLNSDYHTTRIGTWQPTFRVLTEAELQEKGVTFDKMVPYWTGMGNDYYHLCGNHLGISVFENLLGYDLYPSNFGIPHFGYLLN